MKKLFILIPLLMVLTGCMNLVENDNGKIIKVEEKICFAEDGKTPVSKTTTTTTEKKKKEKKDNSFTVGSKGFGSYSFFRDISFM